MLFYAKQKYIYLYFIKYKNNTNQRLLIDYDLNLIFSQILFQF